MRTSVINSRVVLTLRLICHDERIYEESINVDCIFLHKITGLVQNLPKATINPSTKKKLNPWDFSLPLDSYVNKTNWRKCFHNTQNAVIQENLKTNEAYEGSH